MSAILKRFQVPLLACFAFMLLIHAQDQTEYTSIDCGGTHLSSYNEEVTGLTFVPDKDFIDTGESKMVSTEYRGTYSQQYDSLRSFPKGNRNCYRLNLTSSTKYLIRATFFYGNYDGNNKLPEFELHLGPNLWDTVTLQSSSDAIYSELIHIPLRDYIHVCLVNIGSGVPFVSTIEIRQFPNTTFQKLLVDQQSLDLVTRADTGQVDPRQSCRYPIDIYDRIWHGYADWDDWTELTASTNVDTSDDDYKIPPVVMNTAATPKIETDSFVNIWTPDESNDDTAKYYILLHFAEVVKLQANDSRWFDITMNGQGTTTYSPVYGSNTFFILTLFHLHEAK